MQLAKNFCKKRTYNALGFDDTQYICVQDFYNSIFCTIYMKINQISIHALSVLQEDFHVSLIITWVCDPYFV